jgi:hypothetical protein
VRNFETTKLKVNDGRANPFEIAAIVVWKVVETAEALFVHRNTLLYRMERIREISGLDLDNPETRLSIQLALRANRLLTAREE